MANTLIFSYFMETLSTVYGLEIKVKCDTIKLAGSHSNVPVIAVKAYQSSHCPITRLDIKISALSPQ